MKKKAKTSIKLWIFLPVLLMGIVISISNMASITNIRNVNREATEIADTYLEGISRLADIQSMIKDIHSMALSHIVATDSDTMIVLVDSVREKEDTLDAALVAYKDYLSEEDYALYENILVQLKNCKNAIATMMALSADNRNEEAFAIANTDLKTATDAINTDIEAFISKAQAASDEARESLANVYANAISTMIVTSVIGLATILLTFAVVHLKITKPIAKTEKELSNIITDINNRQGDLTKRISICSRDEIGSLADGINAFIEKLQSILKMVTQSSAELNTIGEDVTASMALAGNSVSDLSAMTEELAATMEGIGQNAVHINENATSVNEEVANIAEKTTSISDYSKQMKQHADQMSTMAHDNMENTSKKVSQILDVLNRAIEESDSVKQVDSLTEDILNIAEETNLLALNASIEAARAGEAGRGFAVVATQISHLAAQSQDAANRIQEINGTVTAAVQNLAEHSTDLVNYLNESVLPDFDTFVTAGNEYRENATYIENIMDEFVEKTDSLKATMEQIAQSIDSISQAIDDGVNGVSSTAENMQSLVSEVDDVTDKMEENQKIASALKKETTVFVNL